MNNILNSIDAEKLSLAIKTVKDMIGAEEAAKLEKSFAGSHASRLTEGLSDAELLMVKNVIENPELLRKILSTAKGKEAIGKIIK